MLVFFLNHAMIKLTEFQGNKIYKQLSSSHKDTDSIIQYAEDLLKVYSYYNLKKDTEEYKESEQFKQKWLNGRLSDINEVCRLGEIDRSILYHLIIERNCKFLKKLNLAEKLKYSKNLNQDLKDNVETYTTRIKSWKESILNKFGSLDPLQNPNNKKYKSCVWHITSSEIEPITVYERMNTSAFSNMKDISNNYFHNLESLSEHLGLLTLNLLKKDGLLEDNIENYLKAKRSVEISENDETEIPN